MTKRKKMAGQLHREAVADTTRYDAVEVGHELASDVLEQVWTCIDRSKEFLDVPEFCVVMLICDDNILLSAKRRKFYAWPFLPEPRPRQTVFHYRKDNDTVCRLWSLPTPEVMAVMSCMPTVDSKFLQTKGWVEAFYRWTKRSYFGLGTSHFFDYIRKESDIKMLTEREHTKRLSEVKAVDCVQDQIETLIPQEFDAFKAFDPQVEYS